MKKIVPIVAFVLFVLSSCKKAEEQLYTSHENICFNFDAKQIDSIIYSFANTPGLGSDTIFLPVRISGNRTSTDRKFVIKALADSSTAQPELHYEAFKDFYIMPADSGKTLVPLIIYNKDANLNSNSVNIRFRLYESADFGVQIPNLRDGKVTFSATLERPSWWSFWSPLLEYSRTKHQLFIIATDVTELSEVGLDAPKNLYIISLMTSMLKDPAAWIRRNPLKEYQLVKIKDPNGIDTDDYYFYTNFNPQKKFIYKKDATGSGYHFVDEKGLVINY